MRVPFALLILMIVFAVSTDATTASVNPNHIKQTQRIMLRSATSEKRFLETRDAVHVGKVGNDEERSVLSNLFQKVGGKMQEVRHKRTPSEMFSKLRLGETKIAGKNQNVAKWLRYTIKYRKANRGDDSFPDDKIYDLLAKNTATSELAVTLQSLKEIPDLAPLATRLQIKVFKTWSPDINTISHVLGLAKHGEPVKTQNKLTEGVRIDYLMWLTSISGHYPNRRIATYKWFVLLQSCGFPTSNQSRTSFQRTLEHSSFEFENRVAKSSKVQNYLNLPWLFKVFKENVVTSSETKTLPQPRQN